MASLNGYMVIHTCDHSVLFGLETCSTLGCADVGVMLHGTEKLTEDSKHEGTARLGSNLFSVFSRQARRRRSVHIRRNVLHKDVDANLKERYLISVSALC